MGGDPTRWRDFVLGVYAADGVSAAALLLQDRCGADVNVVLLAAYVAAVHGGEFDADDAAAARRAVGAWQTDVVTPLRAVRRRLVDGPLPAPSPGTDALRDRIKVLELDAELIEVDELTVLAEHPGRPAGPHRSHERTTGAMHVVVRAACGREPEPDEMLAIDVIAAASADWAAEN